VIRTRNAGQRRSLSPCLGLRRDLGFARFSSIGSTPLRISLRALSAASRASRSDFPAAAVPV